MNIRQVACAIVALVTVAAGTSEAGLFGGNSRSREYAERLLIAFNAPQGLATAIDNIITAMSEEDPEFTVDAGGYRKFAEKYLKWDDVKAKFIDTYVDTFTESELEQLVKFYESPVGRKSIEKATELLLRSSEVVQGVFAAKATELDALVRAERIRVANELLGIENDGAKTGTPQR